MCVIENLDGTFSIPAKNRNKPRLVFDNIIEAMLEAVVMHGCVECVEALIDFCE